MMADNSAPSTSNCSASSESRSESISTMPWFVDAKDSEKRGDLTAVWYSLKNIGSAVGVDVDDMVENLQSTNNLSDKVAGKCVAAICESVDTRYVVDINLEIAGMKDLPHWFVKTTQRPDIIVYTDGTKSKVAVTVEVRSSPMLYTERKTILGAATMLRLLRCSSVDVDKFVAFAFPNLDDQCIIRIEVRWVKFRFESTMKRFKDVTSALTEFKDVMSKQAKSLPPLPSTPIRQFSMKLSDRECADLCQSPCAMCEQMVTSNHVMVKSDDYVYKIIHCSSESENYFRFMQMVTGTPVHLTVPQVASWGCPIVLKYKYAFYSPLDVSEAKHCLRSLIAGIKESLDELHSFGLSHNDVRLPNICFNSSYQVMLIDMDRCCPCESYHPMFGSSSSSCMYTLLSDLKDGKMTDFFQLAWLVMWILDHSENYHERKWDSQKKEIKDDKFIRTLVMEGKYDPYLLQNSAVVTETTTLENVLQQREPQ